MLAINYFKGLFLYDVNPPNIIIENELTIDDAKELYKYASLYENE